MYACRSVSVACRPAEKRRRRGEIGSIHRSILVGHRRPNRPQGVNSPEDFSGVKYMLIFSGTNIINDYSSCCSTLNKKNINHSSLTLQEHVTRSNFTFEHLFSDFGVNVHPNNNKSIPIGGQQDGNFSLLAALSVVQVMIYLLVPDFRFRF